MIELIFVIVILGILAAVAIPRLAATRDDAGIAKSLSELSTMVGDFGSYYTSQGKFDGNGTNVTVSTMTNVQDINSTTGSLVAIYYTADNAGDPEACVDFTFTTDGNVTLSDNAVAPSGNICTGVQSSSAYADLKANTQSFGGRKVNF